MLQPKRVKYRNVHRGRRSGVSTSGNELNFGEFGLKALRAAWLTARQIEAARRAITHHVKRGGQIWVRAFPDRPVTKKPLEVRMGGGKGPVDQWVAVVRPGRILFEMSGVNPDVAREALKLGAAKLPIPTRFVDRGDTQVSATEGRE